MYLCEWVLSLEVMSTSLWLWTNSPPGSSVQEFSRLESWNGLPCPPPGDLPNPGIKPESLTGRWFFNTSATWEAHVCTDKSRLVSYWQRLIDRPGKSAPSTCLWDSLAGDAAVQRADTASSRRSLAGGGRTGSGSVGDGLGDLGVRTRAEDGRRGQGLATRLLGAPPLGSAGRVSACLCPRGQGEPSMPGWHLDHGCWPALWHPWVPGASSAHSQTRKDTEHRTEPNISSLEPVSLFSLFSFSSFSLSQDPSAQSPGRGRFRGLTLT